MTFFNRASLSTAAAVLAIWAAGNPVTAQVALEPSLISVPLDSLAKGVEVQVVNSGSATVLLTSWKLDTFTSRSGKQLAGRPTTNIRGGLRVPANSRAVLVFELDSAIAAAAEPGRYQSYLTVSYTNGELQAPITATKPQPASRTAARPLAGELTVHARHGSPGEFDETVYIPARQGTEVRADTFVLTAEGSPPVRAFLQKPRPWKTDTLRPEYPITVLNLRGGRTYKGRIYLGTDTAASAVTLTVNASHHLSFFVVAVIVGVLAGLWVRWWTDLGRPINLLRERVLLARPVFKSTLKKHTDAGWPANSLETEFAALQEATAVKVRSLTPYIVKNTEVEQKFTTVRQAVEALEAKAPALAAVTAELQALRQVQTTLLASMGAVATPRGWKGARTPLVLRTVADTLAATQLTLDTLEAARTDAAKQRAFLGSWAKVLQDAVAKREQLVQLGEPRPGEEEVLKIADEKTESALWALWEVPVDGSLDALVASLAEVGTTLQAIASGRARRRKSFGVAAGDGEKTPELRQWVSDEEANRVLPETETGKLDQAKRLKRRRLLRDLALAAGAFLVALLITLSKDYYGSSPFGTLEDYVTVLTWAFGLTASLTLLTSGLASLQSLGLESFFRR